MNRRKCIFTGEDSDFKLVIDEDQHNWAKSVPTTKNYYENNLKDRPLNELEVRQVELFFQLEMTKIKQSTLEKRMVEIRKKLFKGRESFDPIDKLNINFKAAAIESGIADKLYNKENVTTVSERDWDKLQDHIENPPEPTPALKEATKRYKEEFGFEEDENGILYKDGPAEPVSLEVYEEIKNKTTKVLSTPKKDDKIKKKRVVKKKKPTLWD